MTGGRPVEAGPLVMKREMRTLAAEIQQAENQLGSAQTALEEVQASVRRCDGQRRLTPRDAVADMEHYREFDFGVVNARFEQAVRELESILDGRGEPFAADRAALEPVLQRLLR